MENKETWKYIKGYEGLYEISSLGNTKSLERRVRNSPTGSERIVKEKILSPGLGSHGYLTVRIGKESILIHRLVAQTFIPNPKNKPEVNHKNGIKTDNHVENLEWVTRRENMQHAVKVGLQKHANSYGNHQGELNHSSKLTESQVKEIRKLYDIGNFTYMELSEKFGVHYSVIARIIKREKWKHI